MSIISRFDLLSLQIIKLIGTFYLSLFPKVYTTEIGKCFAGQRILNSVCSVLCVQRTCKNFYIYMSSILDDHTGTRNDNSEHVCDNDKSNVLYQS